MSHVSDTIIAFSCLDECRANDVLTYFANLGGSQPIVLDAALAVNGNKTAPQRTVLIGAFNYLDIDALVAFLESLEWEIPDDVQLLIADEHDEPHIYTERLHRALLKKVVDDITLPLWPEERWNLK